MLGKDTLQLYLETYSVVNGLNWIWLNQRNVCVQMKPGGVRTLLLLHYHTKIFAQWGDLSPAKQDMPYAEGLSNAQAIPGNLHPFSQFLILHLPLTLSKPPPPPRHHLTLQREVISRTWAPLLHSVGLNGGLFGLPQTQFPHWQGEPEQERTPWLGRSGALVQLGP